MRVRNEYNCIELYFNLFIIEIIIKKNIFIQNTTHKLQVGHEHNLLKFG